MCPVNGLREAVSKSGVQVCEGHVESNDWNESCPQGVSLAAAVGARARGQEEHGQS